MSAGRRTALARAAREAVLMQLETGEDRLPSLEEALARVGHRTTSGISRRDLLKMGGIVGAGAVLASCTNGPSAVPNSSPPRPSGPTAQDARVVVVGAGLAGLTAAYRLTQAGVHVQLFEARDRVGGRCWTARGFVDGQTAEHGGEFIDTRHVHIRKLARELGLTMEDLWKGFVPGSFSPNSIDGKLLSHTTIHEQLRPVSDAVTAEARRIGVIRKGRKPSAAAYTYGTATPGGVRLDAQSMSDWLDRNVPGVIGAPLGVWLNEVMCGWYGLDMDGLSAATWMDYFLIPTPGADERWHVKGGNDQVPRETAGRLPSGALNLESPLLSVRRRGDGSYELRFGGASSGPLVVADRIILATPFTTLRQVDLSGAGFDAQRMAAIDDLGMGADVKLLLQYDRRPHTFRNWDGSMEHAPPNFETWESSVAQPGTSGLITVYAGGRTGASWEAPHPHGPGPESLISRTVDQINRVVPGTGAHFNGRAWVDLWTLDPWTLGAYAAFTPGQWAKYWGYTGRAEGGVHFAGEHTSTYSQGYLNGGVESGDRTAIEVMGALGIPVPPSLASLPYSKVA